MKFVINMMAILMSTIKSSPQPSRGNSVTLNLVLITTLINSSCLYGATGDELVNKAKTALAQELEQHYIRLEVTPLSHLKDSEQPLEHFQTEIKAKFPTNKRVCVWLKTEHRKIPVWFSVEATARVLVANRTLKAKTSIPENAFSWEERNIAGLPSAPATSPPQNAWLTARIAKNKILLASQITDPPAVKKGEELKVRLNNHLIHVVMDAIALSDGYRGQHIPVQNPINQETFVAEIIDAHQAEVHL